MKKIVKILSIALVVLFAFTLLVACDRPGNGGIEIDTSKTQLYVYYTNAGYKDVWLNNAIQQYEALNAEVSWEEGKTGVQIVPSTPRTWPSMQNVVEDKTNEVFFLEAVNYRQWASQNVMADITSYLKEANPYEESTTNYATVESRFDATTQDLLKVEEKYYGIPFFHGSYGFVYNVELFDENGWYFDPNGNLIGFVGDLNNKSAGPNGNPGDYDDGLPATYEQFYKLCDAIADDYKAIPIIWTGKSYPMFFRELLASLICDFEGYETMTNSFNFTGDHLLAKIENNELVFDDSTTTITDTNGAEVFRHDGIYWGIKFLDSLINNESWRHENSYLGTYTNMNAQEDFIRGKEKIAMLFDADWWMQEASDYFEDYDKYDEDDFKRLPLPKANESKIGEPVTIYEKGDGYAFVSANTASSKVPLAADFLQFLHSSKQMIEYTEITNTLHPINYDMPADAKLTAYTRSLYDYKLNSTAKMVRCISKSSVYYANFDTLFIDDVFDLSVNGLRMNIYDVLSDKGDVRMSPEEVFAKLYEQHTDLGKNS